MSWEAFTNEISNKLSKGAGDLIDAYSEREQERVRPEPVNASNLPKEPDNTTKHDEKAAAQANQQTQQAAAEAKANAQAVMLPWVKWGAIGLGSVVALGVVAMLARGR